MLKTLENRWIIDRVPLENTKKEPFQFLPAEIKKEV
jgi:hypothetical protein